MVIVSDFHTGGWGSILTWWGWCAMIHLASERTFNRANPYHVSGMGTTSLNTRVWGNMTDTLLDDTIYPRIGNYYFLIIDNFLSSIWKLGKREYTMIIY